MPFIEKKYRVARGAMNTGLGGSSYGADIALYTALEYPGVFGHLLVESPPLWIGNDQLLKDAEKAKVLPHKIVSWHRDRTKRRRRSPAQHQGREARAGAGDDLRKKGMGPARLKVVVEEGGQHTEAAWSKRLPEAMLFLYGQ